ncbi:MAG TPA: isochorismate synthase [Thermoanaerobaculia bacterium]|nr:isochorismate synthase [Thermoanaerobaculia bacterium]
MTVARTPATARVAAEDTLQRLAELLAAELGPVPADALVRFVVPAAGLDPRAVLRVTARESYLWESPRGEALGGLGCATLLQGSGEGRLGQVRDAATRASARLVAFSDPEVVAPPALFLGGAAFRREGATRARWAGFGDASFVLPRWLVRRAPSGLATLELTVAPPELEPAARDRLLAEAALLLDAEPATRPGSARSGATPIEASWEEGEATCGRWNAAIAHLLDAIRRGEIRKAVAARWLDVRLPRSTAPCGAADQPAFGVVERVIEGFEQACDECVRFVVQRGGCAFVGATPELLVRLRGRELETHALAGTERNDASPDAGSHPCCAAGGPAARRLLERDKDRREHQLVVEHLVERLAPYCAELTAAETPRVRVLRHLLHLETPIPARLAEDRHILDMAAALHPTPAVAGVPVVRSLELLAEVEAGERGWYAGPVGWFDQRGDGALSVALRSMLIGRRSARLYAGAGIVADSEAAAELEETRWKLAGAWAALSAAVGGALAIEEPAAEAVVVSGEPEADAADAEPPAD